MKYHHHHHNHHLTVTHCPGFQIHIHSHIHIHVHVHVHMHMHMHMYVHIRTRTCIHIHINRFVSNILFSFAAWLMSVDVSILEDGFSCEDRQPEIVSVMESGVPVRVQEWAEMPRDQRGHTHQWNLRFQRAHLSPMEDNHMQDEVTIQGNKRE